MTAAITNLWRRVHAWPRRFRWPLKIASFLTVVAVTLYPKLWLVPTWLHRLRNMNAVLDPGHPGLAAIEREVRQRIAADAAPPVVLKAIEESVYTHIPYAWDWDVWGVFDYLPTVAEVFEKGREDCDGQAVVAASLLRRMGYEAQLVNDVVHTWVVTPYGEIMSPGQGEKTLVADESGTHTRLSPGALANLGRGLSFGIAKFPLLREVIILAALCGLSLQPASSTRRRIVGCVALSGALAIFRVAGQRVLDPGVGTSGAVWAGVALGLTGWLLLLVKSVAQPRRTSPPEPPAGDGVGRD